MEKQIPDKRLLIYHYPEIIQNPYLPINYQYCMHFTKLDVDESGIVEKKETEINNIVIKALQCNMSDFYVFYKPISRVFNE